MYTYSTYTIRCSVVYFTYTCTLQSELGETIWDPKFCRKMRELLNLLHKLFLFHRVGKEEKFTKWLS